MSEPGASMLRFWLAGGTLMPVLAVVSFVIWYLSLRLYLPLVLASRRMERASQNCGGLGNTSGPQRSQTKDSDALIGPIRNCRDTELDVTDRLLKIQVAELRPYERELRILRAFVVSAPLLGLLGTVKGMIMTFTALGGYGMTSMDVLSKGISEALITTQVGLVVALPGLVSAHASARLIKRLRIAFDRIGLHVTTLRRKEARAKSEEASA